MFCHKSLTQRGTSRGEVIGNKKKAEKMSMCGPNSFRDLR